MKLVVASLLFAAMVAGAASETTDVGAEIRRVLAGRDNMGSVIRYLEMSETDLKTALPTVDKDGKPITYTFFAPTTTAYILKLPQDIGDPFFSDAGLRKEMLLGQFVPKTITKEELNTLDKLTMLDSTEITLTHEEGVTKMDGRTTIKEEVIKTSFGNIYIVNGVFISHEKVSEAIRKLPAPANHPLIPPQPKGKAESDPEPEPLSLQRSKPTRNRDRSARQIDGGFNPVGVGDKDVIDVANFALEALAANTNSGPVSLVKITSAAKQIVAGQNYKLVLELVKKGADNNKDPLSCEVVISVNLSSVRSLSTSKCVPGHSRKLSHDEDAVKKN